ncbi:redoxin domain-containing protein [Flavobacterium sp.]|uniref:redoxin domain-containing protein n=2 Tax=Flavobacterium sp. TaxID=239 RepID=UPI004048CD40
MKNTHFTLILFFCVFYANAQKQFTISGTINSSVNNSKIFIEEVKDNTPILKDSTVIKNGKFEFKGNIESLDIAFIKLEKDKAGLPFILEKGKIAITFDKDSLNKSRISGTQNNDKFQEFSDKIGIVNKKMLSFQQENMSKMQTAQQTKDTATINSIMKSFTALQDEMKGVSTNFIKNNPKAFISVLILENLMLNQSITTEETQEFYNKLGKESLETKYAKNIEKTLKSMGNLSIGKKAPDFSGPSPDGNMISLKESLGKITIIDFWASWCGPCRAENPNVVAMYNEYHSKGLNIIGVSLDRDAAKWKEAIAKDELTWTHVSNLKFWQDPIAELYSIKSIPATYILDEKGNIIAKDLRGEELVAKVRELLK